MNTKYFVVTGSSKGVGLEICRILLERQYFVIGISRTPGPLQLKPRYKWLKCDLSVREQVIEICEHISGICNKRLDGIVFNAAEGYYGPGLLMDNDVINTMIAVNFSNAIVLLKTVSPFFSNDAEVIYVSTSASRIPAPMMAAYAATKLAFESFIQSVGLEYGYKFHIIRSAEIDTGFAKRVGVPDSVDMNKKRLSPKKVAEGVVSTIGSKTTSTNIGIRAWLIEIVLRVFPKLLFYRNRYGRIHKA